MSKSNSAEVINRISIVTNMILDGYATRDIVRFGTSKEVTRNNPNPWGVSSRMVDKYIAKAKKFIIEDANEMRSENIEWHLTARKRLLTQAKNTKDIRLAKDITRDIAELQGLYPRKQLEIQTKAIPATREDLIRQINEFANNLGLTVEEYCEKEGIDLNNVTD